MGRFRFSVTTFLIVVTLLAGGLAALVSQSQMGASLAYSTFLTLICLAVVGAIATSHERRAFWLGFALFGWCYWFVEYKPAAGTPAGYSGYVGWYASASPTPAPSLLTTQLLVRVEEGLSPNRKIGSPVMAQWRGGGYYPGTITEADGNGNYLVAWSDGSAAQWTSSSQLQPSTPQARVTGHAIMGSLWALLGGALATILFGGARNPKREVQRPASSPGNS